MDSRSVSDYTSLSKKALDLRDDLRVNKSNESVVLKENLPLFYNSLLNDNSNISQCLSDYNQPLQQNTFLPLKDSKLNCQIDILKDTDEIKKYTQLMKKVDSLTGELTSKRKIIFNLEQENSQLKQNKNVQEFSAKEILRMKQECSKAMDEVLLIRPQNIKLN